MPTEVTVQQRLCQRYERFREEADIKPTFAERLSCPLLLHVSDSWLKSRFRLLVVGQETFGWNFFEGQYYQWPYPPMKSFKDFKVTPNSIEALVHGYKSFDYSKYEPRSAAGCFWTAYRKLRTELESGVEGSVAWANIFRVDVDGGSVLRASTSDELNLIFKLQAGLLSDEIAVMQPNAVLFFTGPNCDDALQREFENVRFRAFGSKPLRAAALLEHPRLPRHSFRTYHPTYLRRKKLGSILDEIVDKLKA